MIAPALILGARIVLTGASLYSGYKLVRAWRTAPNGKGRVSVKRTRR